MSTHIIFNINKMELINHIFYFKINSQLSFEESIFFNAYKSIQKRSTITGHLRVVDIA